MLNKLVALVFLQDFFLNHAYIIDYQILILIKYIFLLLLTIMVNRL